MPSGWSDSPDCVAPDDLSLVPGGVPGGGVAGFVPDGAGVCDPDLPGCACGLEAGGSDDWVDPGCGAAEDDVPDGGVPEGELPAGGAAGGVPAGGAESPGGVITATFWMITGLSGASALKGPNAPVGTTPIRSTTSIPCTT